jgi:hypothetical protein
VIGGAFRKYGEYVLFIHPDLPKRDEVTGEWRKLLNEELHDLYSSPSIIRIMKSRRRWAGHVALMEEKRNAYMYIYECQRERGH